MEKYTGSGNAGVSGYESIKNGIILQFKDGESYLYNYVKPGKNHVENMKILAVKGSGLTTYVNQYVRSNYYEKL